MILNREGSYIDSPKWLKTKLQQIQKIAEIKLKSPENVCKNHNFCNLGGKVKKCVKDATEFLSLISKIHKDLICYLCKHGISTRKKNARL